MDEGKIIKWDMSAFDDDGIATIDIITDSEDTWNDIKLKSSSIRNKGDFVSRQFKLSRVLWCLC